MKGQRKNTKESILSGVFEYPVGHGIPSTSRKQEGLQIKDVYAGMGSQEAALAGLHTDAVALLMRVELAAGQAQQQAAGHRHQQALSNSLDTRRAQSAIWGKTTAAQQRLDQTRLEKVRHSHLCLLCIRAANHVSLVEML